MKPQTVVVKQSGGTTILIWLLIILLLIVLFPFLACAACGGVACLGTGAALMDMDMEEMNDIDVDDDVWEGEIEEEEPKVEARPMRIDDIIPVIKFFEVKD